MKFIVLFEDNSSADPAIRKMHMEDHLKFLESNGSIIETAGPLTALSGAPAGALWVLECENSKMVDNLIRMDPFWPTGLRNSYKILQWRHVYANRARQI